VSVRVANISAARAIATSQYSADVDHAVYVDTYGDYFRFRHGGTLTPVDGVVFATNDGLGQLERMGVPNRVFHAAQFWAIDPVGGSDENKGWGATQAAAEAVPLKTMAELDRRLASHPGYTTTPLFSIMCDIPLSDARVMANVRTAPTSSAFPMFAGKIGAPLATGTMAGYTAKNVGAGTGQTYLMNLTSAASYVGKMVIDSDSTYAFVLGAASANVAQISTPMYEQHGPVVPSANPAEPGDFVNGKSFGVYDLYRLPAYPFLPDIQYGAVAQLKIGQAVVSSFSNPNLGGSASYVMKCIVETGLQAGNGTSGSWTGGFTFWGGDLFYGTASTSAITFLHHSGNFHCPAFMRCRVNFMNGSGARFQEEAMLYGAEARVFLDETSSLSGVPNTTPRLQVGVFSTTNPAFSGGRVRLPSDGGTVYGASNTSNIFSVPQGSSYSVPKAGCTAATSGNVLSVGGTAKAFSDVPFINTTNNATITDGP